MSQEVADYLRDLAAEFEKVVDSEGNDWMLFIYEVEPPWFIAKTRPKSVLTDEGWTWVEDHGPFTEAVAMLRKAAQIVEAKQ